MKNRYLAIALSIFIFACGSNAENSATKKINKTEPVIKTQKNFATPATTSVQTKEEHIAEPKEVAVAKQKNKTKKQTPKTTVVTEKKEEETVDEIQETAEKVYPTVDEIRPNHEAWNNLTKKYVSTTGRVNYKGMKADLTKITTYLAQLNKISPQNNWTRNEKLAYWINLYNASTVYLITTNYPVSSITKINGGKPWDKKFVKSGNKTYTLNDIENTIVRPTFKDPRVHAALNCAAKSCPKIMNGAFLPNKLNAQLDAQVRAWINDSFRNKLTADKIEVSQIFDWYKTDFVVKGGVIKFINAYINTNIAVNPNAKITYLPYNWALNE